MTGAGARVPAGAGGAHVFVALAVLIASCRPAAHEQEPRRCVLSLDVVSAQPARLRGRLSCAGDGFRRLRLGHEGSAEHLHLVAGARRLDAGVAVPEGRGLDVRWELDLEGLAAGSRSFELAVRTGESVTGPLGAWWVAPEPASARDVVDVTVRVPPGVGFATGLVTGPACGEGCFAYRLAANELPVATYATLGRFTEQVLALGEEEGVGGAGTTGPRLVSQRADSAVPRSVAKGADRTTGARATLRVVVADGERLATDDALVGWVRDAAGLVERFYGRFPAPHATVTLLPVPGRDRVVFGKVLPESAPGIAVLVGAGARDETLRRDWILVHELFHLGVPSFDGEGTWLDEGLATYFEPLLRVRGGWLEEREAWAELARSFPKGYPALRGGGLEAAQDFGGIYWGGAALCFLADLEARRRTGGKVGLEHGLRAVLARGGHASEVWRLDRVIQLVDAALGAPTLRPLADRHARRGAPIDLSPALRALGVVPARDGFRLDDGAPLAPLRRAMTWGAARS